MSKLDDILHAVYASAIVPKEIAKQQVKDLMLELIGEDDTYETRELQGNDQRNLLRKELRQKVNEL